MTIADRRAVVAGFGVVLGAGAAAAAGPKPRPGLARDAAIPAGELGLESGSERDQTARLQAAIDASSRRGVPAMLPPGRIVAARLELKPGTRLLGVARSSTIALSAGGGIGATGAAGSVLEGFVIDGGGVGTTSELGALLALRLCTSVELRDLEVLSGAHDGIALESCSGRLSGCTVHLVGRAGIRSLDAGGLDIAGNTVTDCADNGILVWRSKAGEDGTVVAGNRVERIGAASGGSGQNGNGINVFRAGGVLVTGNRIADCAFTAIRGNAASDIQMVANHCTRLGEVAIYAEFGFEGALIASNLVDTAATGISVTNFNEGGRLAVVQGNLIRNLFRREHEPDDKRGEGIGVEADTLVTGNTIEGAPTCGLKLGFGAYLRDVSATNNLIRASRVGILVTSGAGRGSCQIAGNVISGARDGAIRSHDHDRVEGPDLATGAPPPAGVTISGNIVA